MSQFVPKVNAKNLQKSLKESKTPVFTSKSKVGSIQTGEIIRGNLKGTKVNFKRVK